MMCPATLDGLLYIHPYNNPQDELVPIGAVSLLNRVGAPHLGRYAFELDEEKIHGARCFAIDLHWYFSIEAVFHIATELKQLNPGAPIILGGITASFYAEYLMQSFPIDYLVAGDGEHAFPRLVEAILEGRSPPPLPNVWTKRGPPPARRPVTPDELGANDYSTLDWFPTLQRATEAAHERYAMNPEFGGSDRYLPIVPLSRGCRYLCNMCFGAYQPDVFASDQVDQTAAGLARTLDSIEAHPIYRFVTLVNGTEDMLRFDSFRGVFRRRRALGAHIMHFCDLPSDEVLQLLLEGFEGLTIGVTAPFGLSLPFGNGKWTQDTYEERLIEMARLISQADNSRLAISFLGAAPPHFKERLLATSDSVQLKNNAEWVLPRPNVRDLEPFRPRGEAKRRQAEGFRRVSVEHARYGIAAVIAPDLLFILDRSHERDVDGSPAHGLELDDPRLESFRDWYVDRYRRWCVGTLPEVAVDVEWLRTAEAGSSAEFRPVAASELTGVGGPLAIRFRFDGMVLSWQGRLPATLAATGDPVALALMVRVGYGDERCLELRDHGDLRKLVLPVPREVSATTELRLEVRLSRQVIRYELRGDGPSLSCAGQVHPEELGDAETTGPRGGETQGEGDESRRGGGRVIAVFQRLLGLPPAGSTLVRAELGRGARRIELTFAGRSAAETTLILLPREPEAGGEPTFLVGSKGPVGNRSAQRLIEHVRERLRPASYGQLEKVFRVEETRGHA